MELFIIFIAIVFSMATSLGVGGSTIAIVNFFAAIADGSIDPNERHMMGYVYVVLRVAMVTLFFSLALLTAFGTYHNGAAALTPYLAAQWTIMAFLYGNATLMTLRVMPSTVGPALQAGSWYMLGLITSLVPLGLAGFSYLQFAIGYAVVVALAISIVNGMMAYLKSRRTAPTA